ncbi:ATP-dependent Clp protease ATP-binding subunit, partial [Veillonellaceae bacterium M2-4]|nr:ATP-dependent Clp protease ATP-binding subunit [Veillonellaceae bacterium M2-4]
RDDQINAVIEILSRRKKNNPVLIGPAGVGQTSIVEGLAQRIASGDVPDKLRKMHIYELNINDMVAGSSLLGSFEEKIKKVIDLAQKDPNTILFIDELHNIVGAGST